MKFNFPRYKIFLAIIDFSIIILSFMIALYFVSIQKNINFLEFLFDTPLLDVTILFSAFIFILIFQAHNLYKINVFLSNSLQAISLLKSLFIGILILLAIIFLIKFPYLFDSRVFLLLFTIIVSLLLVFSRFYILRIVYKKFPEGKIFHRNLLIVGAGKSGKLFATKLFIEGSKDTTLIGFVDDNKKIGEEVINGKSVLGNISDISSLIDKYDIDEVVIAINNISYERLFEIIDYCNKNKVVVKLISELFDIIPRKVVTEQYSDIPVINLSPQIIGEISTVLKRIVDILGATVGLIILSPLFLIVAVLIKISSKGPVLFVQDRVGKDGKVFKFYKFRSMKGAEKDDEDRKKAMLEFMKNEDVKGDVKVINNSRVTWIGKIIRKFSIDELPQILNVLKGDMSLVGPRPALLYEYENFYDWQKKRFNVLPGCTGVWQIYGRGNVSFKDSILLDIYYINNMSPWLDIQLILKTFPVMIFGKGGK